MSQEVIEKLIPILASTVGVGFIRSMTVGVLRKAVKGMVKGVITVLILLACGWLFYQYWL
ncbi:hypothetical protein [Enterococcus sp. 5B3_DIV0040]|uniref:hypothetical protein n=1 Tax=Enterococcus sp. 5B3_DIV0040 TaxID=1834182 RepID=UPI000A331DEC|nr:hypothetical protein [Enterococcus sp. 5B3_DIV0040]OTO02261.1 hypothetical protein A5883_003088 [Enterococcus sp. 5B3_DIV0040]